MTQRGTRTDKNPTRVGRSTKINRPILAKSHQSSDWNPPDEAIRKTRSQSRPRTNDHTHKKKEIVLFQLIIRLSSELYNLETMTGFESNKTDLLSNSSSTTLANALLGLVGHVKQVIMKVEG